MAVECDTGLNWKQFVEAMAEALVSPNQDVLVKYAAFTLFNVDVTVTKHQ